MEKVFIAFAAVVVALVSCQKEMTTPAVISSNQDSFIASLEDATKTIIDDNLQVKWAADDSISVNGVIYKISAFLNQDSTRAEFTKRDEDQESPRPPFKAYYPINDFRSDGTLKSKFLRRTNENRFNMPMVAESNTRTMEFQNPYGVLAIKISSNEVEGGVSMISVFEGDKGQSVMFYESPYCPVDSLGKIFYIPMEPRTYDNLEIRAVNQNETVTMFTKDDQQIEIKANTIYPFNFVNTPLVGFTLNKDTINMSVIDDDILEVANYEPANASVRKVIWESSDSSIVLVNNGIVLPVGVGNATITATSVDGGYQRTCDVTVHSAVYFSSATVSNVYDFQDSTYYQFQFTVVRDTFNINTAADVTVNVSGSGVDQLEGFNPYIHFGAGQESVIVAGLFKNTVFNANKGTEYTVTLTMDDAQYITKNRSTCNLTAVVYNWIYLGEGKFSDLWLDTGEYPVKIYQRDPGKDFYRISDPYTDLWNYRRADYISGGWGVTTPASKIEFQVLHAGDAIHKGDPEFETLITKDDYIYYSAINMGLYHPAYCSDVYCFNPVDIYSLAGDESNLEWNKVASWQNDPTFGTIPSAVYMAGSRYMPGVGGLGGSDSPDEAIVVVFPGGSLE